MTKRPVWTQALMAVTLAACAALGAPASPLHLLRGAEEEAAGKSAEAETTDHPALCASGPRRGKMRDCRTGADPSAQTRLTPSAIRRRAVSPLPSRTPPPDAWSVPFRC